MRKNPRLAHAVAALGLIAAALPAHALVGGAVDANTASSPWAGVVSITPITGEVYSGALLDRQHVLTAAHVAARFVGEPGKLTINVNTGSVPQQFTASRVFVHPDYATGNLPTDSAFAWNDDIAVIRLAQPVGPDVPVYPLFGGTPGIAGAPVNFAMVAYGGHGDGISASLLQGANATVKRVGQNRVEAFFLADDEGGGAPTGVREGFVFVFDAAGTPNHLPGEAGYAGGDSGSPIFVNVGGQWRIAGVGAFNGSPAGVPGTAIQFGAIGGGMLIAPYADWIQAQMATPVPEPRTHALMLAGLGCVAAAALRRRKAARESGIR